MEYKFNGLLDNENIDLIQDSFPEGKLTYLSFENLFVDLKIGSPPFLRCTGKARATFKQASNSLDLIHFDFSSLFDELPIPYADRGKIQVESILEPWQSLKEKIKNRVPAHTYQYHGGVTNDHYDTVSAIKFYGDNTEDFMDRLDLGMSSEMLNEYLTSEGLYPKIICKSIEFVALEHTNGSFTVLNLQYGGFWVHFFDVGTDLLSTLSAYRDKTYNNVSFG